MEFGELLSWRLWGARIIYVGCPTCPDSVAKYGGQVDNFKAVWKLSGLDDDFAEAESMKVNWNALQIGSGGESGDLAEIRNRIKLADLRRSRSK